MGYFSTRDTYFFQYSSDGLTLTKCLKDLSGTVEIASGINNIGSYAFSERRGIEKVIIENGLKRIEHYAFSACSNLKGIDLPDSLTFIGSLAFDRSGLTSIIIPGSVESIGRAAFWSCDDLFSVTIYKGVKRIETEAFYRCRSLRNVEIADSVEYIGVDAFDTKGALSIILFHGTRAQWKNAYQDNHNRSPLYINVQCRDGVVTI